MISIHTKSVMKVDLCKQVCISYNKLMLSLEFAFMCGVDHVMRFYV